MNQGVESKVLLEPCSVGILGLLIHRERYSSHQGHRCHRCSDSSKETPQFLRFIGVSNAVGEAIVFVGLHSSLNN